MAEKDDVQAWDRLTPNASPRLIRLVAGTIRGNRHSAPVVVDPGDWPSLLQDAVLNRVTPQLARAVEAGSLVLHDRGRLQLAQAQLAASHTVARLQTLRQETVTLLAEDGIRTLVLKGPAVAVLDYPTVEDRHYIDVDLMVRSADFDRAVAALTRAGHARLGLPQRRAGFDRRFAKGLGYVTRAGLGIDLHRTFCEGPFGALIQEDELWSDAVPLPGGEATEKALGRSQRFLHACYHSAVGDYVPRLVPLLDVVMIAASPSFDADRVLSLARSWRSEVVVAAAVRLAWRIFTPQPNDVSRWAECYRPPRRELTYLSLYDRFPPPGPQRALAQLSSVPRSDLLRYAVGYGFPSRTYLAGRHKDLARYWLYHLRRAARQRHHG